MLLPTILDSLLRLAVEGAAAKGLALVVEVFAARKRDLDLDEIAVEEDAQGYDGQPFLPDLRAQPLDLALVKQQAATADRIVVGVPGRFVRAHVAADEEGLTAGKRDVRLLEVDLARADRFDLGSKEFDPGRLSLKQMVGMAGSSVGRQDSAAFAHRITLPRTSTI